jgi:hypothetical protein
MKAIMKLNFKILLVLALLTNNVKSWSLPVPSWYKKYRCRQLLNQVKLLKKRADGTHFTTTNGQSGFCRPDLNFTKNERASLEHVNFYNQYTQICNPIIQAYHNALAHYNSKCSTNNQFSQRTNYNLQTSARVQDLSSGNLLQGNYKQVYAR